MPHSGHSRQFAGTDGGVPASRSSLCASREASTGGNRGGSRPSDEEAYPFEGSPPLKVPGEQPIRSVVKDLRHGQRLAARCADPPSGARSAAASRRLPPLCRENDDAQFGLHPARGARVAGADQQHHAGDARPVSARGSAHRGASIEEPDTTLTAGSHEAADSLSDSTGGGLHSHPSSSAARGGSPQLRLKAPRATTRHASITVRPAGAGSHVPTGRLAGCSGAATHDTPPSRRQGHRRNQ
jgi:hypothetical protein